MENWHNISEKLPKINECVFILSKKKNARVAKLMIYDEKMFSLNFDYDERLRNGDAFWRVININSNMEEKRYEWTTTKQFPYWLTQKELIEHTLHNETTEDKPNRLNILDL